MLVLNQIESHELIVSTQLPDPTTSMAICDDITQRLDHTFRILIAALTVHHMTSGDPIDIFSPQRDAATRGPVHCCRFSRYIG